MGRAAAAPPSLAQERRAAVRQWLVEGVPAAQVAAFAQQVWGADRAQVRRLVRAVRRRWAAQAAGADFLAHLWEAKLQREQLYDKANRQLAACAEATPAYAGLVRTCQQILKERDRLMAHIQAHRAKTHRDASPDGRAARTAGGQSVTVGVEELVQRLEHWRNQTYHQWTAGRAAAGHAP